MIALYIEAGQLLHVCFVRLPKSTHTAFFSVSIIEILIYRWIYILFYGLVFQYIYNGRLSF